MSDNSDPIEQAKARFLAEQAAKFDRDMALLRQLAEQYPDMAATIVGAPPTIPHSVPAVVEQKADEQFGQLSVRELARLYKTQSTSGYPALRFRTRENYDSLIRRLDKDIGSTRILDLSREYIWGQFERWCESGEHMARSLIGMVRILASFGATELKDRACRELKLTLHEMRFPAQKSRTPISMTPDQVNSFRKAAHSEGLHSLALAQAIQFDTGLRQKDVVGEYVPIEEAEVHHLPDTYDRIIHDGKIWTRGLKWSSISEDFRLTHTLSQTQKKFECDLRDKPIVMDELRRIFDLPATNDPIIISEVTGRPWTAHDFRRKWRAVANLAGIPSDVKNMDSRPASQERPHRAQSRGTK